jgi:hypothetical protein
MSQPVVPAGETKTGNPIRALRQAASEDTQTQTPFVLVATAIRQRSQKPRR